MRIHCAPKKFSLSRITSIRLQDRPNCAGNCATRDSINPPLRKRMSPVTPKISHIDLLRIAVNLPPGRPSSINIVWFVVIQPNVELPNHGHMRHHCHPETEVGNCVIKLHAIGNRGELRLSLVPASRFRHYSRPCCPTHQSCGKVSGARCPMLPLFY